MNTPHNYNEEKMEQIATHINRFSNLIEKSNDIVNPLAILAQGILLALKASGQDVEAEKVAVIFNNLGEYVFDVLEISETFRADLMDVMDNERKYLTDILTEVAKLK